jgi:D-sedoheptulose 7-phosphate isomerase
MMLEEAFAEHAEVLTKVRESLMGDLRSAAALAEEALRQGKKLLVFGNGGSAADAQHFAAELVGRFERERRGLPALALTANTSSLTAVGNDYGYDRVFDRQVEAFAEEGDVLIAISTSGNSENVVRAVKTGKALGCVVIGLTGEGGGKLAAECDVLLAIPSKRVSRIQEMHEICLHSLAGWLEAKLDPDGASDA